MFAFETLIAYKKSIVIAGVIYSITKSWPKQETFALIDQMHRSITSIALNIAEGSSRSKKDFRHYLDIARGSCFESIAISTIALNQNYLTLEEFKKIYSELEEITKIIQGLKKSLL